MDRVQSVEELQGLCSRPSGADAKPSFTRASILFVCVCRGLDRNKSRAGQRRVRDRSLDIRHVSMEGAFDRMRSQFVQVPTATRVFLEAVLGICGTVNL